MSTYIPTEPRGTIQGSRHTGVHGLTEALITSRAIRANLHFSVRDPLP